MSNNFTRRIFLLQVFMVLSIAPLFSAFIDITSGPTAGGVYVRILAEAGEDFGVVQGAGSVTIDGVPSPFIVEWLHTRVGFYTPPGVGANLAVVLTTDAGTMYTSSNNYSYDSPTISSISPATGSTLGGETITVTGNNFGTGAGNPEVRVNGELGFNVTVINHTMLEFALPPGAGANLDVTVTVAGQTGTGTGIFSYEPPEIVQVFEPTGLAGHYVRILGSNFGSDFLGTSITVTVGGVMAVIVSSQHTHNEVGFYAPNISGTNLPVQIVVEGQVSNDNLTFSYLPLPVELVRFDAFAEKDAVRLIWATGSELGSDYFQIEHSVDSKNFASITRVNAAGNSLDYLTYESIHPTPARGWNYYRLVQVDRDGSSAISKVVGVYIGSKPLEAQLHVFPNPVLDGKFSTIIDSAWNQEVILQLTGVNGQILKTWKDGLSKGKNTLEYVTDDLEPGTYFLQVATKGWNKKLQLLVLN